MNVAKLMEDQNAWVAEMPILDYYKVGETARLMGIVESQIYHMIRHRGLPAVKFSSGSKRDQGEGRVRIPHDGLVEWMTDNQKARYAMLDEDRWLMVIPQKETYVVLDVARILGITSGQVYSKIRYNALNHITVQPLGYAREYIAIEHDELVRYADWALSNEAGAAKGKVEVEPYDGY